MTRALYERATSIVSRSLAGDVSVEEATEFLSSLGSSDPDDVKDAVHAAVHFVTDEDIRLSDGEYDRSQRELLQGMLRRLELTQ